MERKYVIGIDYGTDSVRTAIVDAANGKIIAVSEKKYERWEKGQYCNPLKNQFRQHPQDYIDGLVFTVKDALSQCDSKVAENIVALGFDTTGSTPVLVDEQGIPLALLPEFKDNPNAMFVLWKDHTAIEEAEEINQLVKRWDINYTKYMGGIYSSEWVWAKVLQLLRTDASVREAAYSWVEHCDWMPALVTGNTLPNEIKRSRCAAGHKAMWSEEWGGLPSEHFLTSLDPLLGGFREGLYSETCTSDMPVGTLSQEWGQKLGLPSSVLVGVGILDAHAGAVGGGIKEGALLKIIGTSTCDIMVVPKKELKETPIPGICGQVDGSVLSDYIGLEAGQSAYGDIFAWFKSILAWPLMFETEKERRKMEDGILERLSEEASKLQVRRDDMMATDWLNGRRTPDANPLLKGSLSGLTLGTTAPMIYKALVEAAAFGSKAIIDRLLEHNVNINEVIAVGGVAKKSDFVMQTLSNVLNLPIKIASSDQSCALGAAMNAAVVGKIYDQVVTAQKEMGEAIEKVYVPNLEKNKVYQENYLKYLNTI